MYEKYSRQSFPNKYLRELIGTAICAFNQNTGILIEIATKENVNSKKYIG